MVNLWKKIEIHNIYRLFVTQVLISPERFAEAASGDSGELRKRNVMGTNGKIRFKHNMSPSPALYLTVRLNVDNVKSKIFLN